MAVQAISRPAYAKHRGCSEVAVHKAIKAGRISVDGNGMIDPVAADAQWRENTRARASARGRPDTFVPLAPAAAPAPATEPTEGDGAYWRSRSRREHAEADLAELRLRELQKELVRVGDVRSSFSRRVASLRDSLLQIPARLAPVVAAEMDQGRCFELIEAELRNALKVLTLDVELEAA
jgi:hypothetical protein